MDLALIQKVVRQQQLIFTDHAVRQMITRVIDVSDVEQAILAGEIIEEYPDDKYSPSCLVYGNTLQGRPLHVVCSAPPRVRIITVYQPDPDEWQDNRTRRS